MEAYCRRRWGGSGWTRDLKQQGREDGATFSNWKWWPNTLKGHQLVEFAKNKGVDTDKSNAVLFNAMYEEGKNIADVSTLLEIGCQMLGLSSEELRPYLENDAGESDVRREMAFMRQRYDISGVPFFIISREDADAQPYGLSGAQRPSTFMKVFDKLMSADED